MKKNILFAILIVPSFLNSQLVKANLIAATTTNYTSHLGSLAPGDTLYLAAGNYTNNLTLNNINGTIVQPIVIVGAGNASILQGQSCCNTVSITKCSYVIIKNLRLDGMNQSVDAVKAEGTVGNWAHHITLEFLTIVNYGASQQNVGISTKCPAWDWEIRKNKIIGAGTGMYLGNSDGTKPFVNGIIEYNFVANTIGYNIEIKHQINGQRELLPETSVNGKTIIRHNVFTKDETSSTGGNARPNVLVGGFATSGWGAADYYEIYGNFFYNNPAEALFQGTGNIMLYENVFVNHYNPSGFRAVYITPHNGVSPQDIKVFHNTVWAFNTSGGIRLISPNSNFRQYCFANAVFAASPITNFSDTLDNITDSYSNAAAFMLSATSNINTLDLYPKIGQLKGATTVDTVFRSHTKWDKDFNGDNYDWTYRGAYSGCCTNKGWKLQLDTMKERTEIIGISVLNNEAEFDIYPNPVTDVLTIDNRNFSTTEIEIYDFSGVRIFTTKMNLKHLNIDFSEKPAGLYLLVLKNQNGIQTKNIIKQ